MKRQHALGGSQLRGFPRHSVDHAGSFVLGNGPGSGFAHAEQTAGAISPHTGQQNAGSARSRRFRDGKEQHVH
jgi:hypothetical protein